ncbi:MAG: hypothetical protein ACTHQ3_07420 [Motilibacteraceae bacterium]
MVAEGEIGGEQPERTGSSRRTRSERERARRRARLLQDLEEARALRRRVAPRKARIAEERRAWWIRSFIGR